MSLKPIIPGSTPAPISNVPPKKSGGTVNPLFDGVENASQEALHQQQPSRLSSLKDNVISYLDRTTLGITIKAVSQFAQKIFTSSGKEKVPENPLYSPTGKERVPTQLAAKSRPDSINPALTPIAKPASISVLPAEESEYDSEESSLDDEVDSALSKNHELGDQVKDIMSKLDFDSDAIISHEYKFKDLSEAELNDLLAETDRLLGLTDTFLDTPDDKPL